MEEILTQYEKLHPYSTRARIIREIGRVKKMSPESEKIFGDKGEKEEKLQKKLKAIKYNSSKRKKQPQYP